MAAINATLTFNPTVPSAVVVSEATFSELKTNAVTALNGQRNAPASQVAAIDTALAALQA